MYNINISEISQDLYTIFTNMDGNSSVLELVKNSFNYEYNEELEDLIRFVLEFLLDNKNLWRRL